MGICGSRTERLNGKFAPETVELRSLTAQSRHACGMLPENLITG